MTVTLEQREKAEQNGHPVLSVAEFRRSSTP
jgi:hypothetical protein